MLVHSKNDNYFLYKKNIMHGNGESDACPTTNSTDYALKTPA